MAIDEFGREIPGGRAQTSTSHQHHTGYPNHNHGVGHHSNYGRSRSRSPGGHHGTNSSASYCNHPGSHRDISTMRYEDMGRIAGQANKNSSGSVRGSSRSRSPGSVAGRGVFRGRSRSFDKTATRGHRADSSVHSVRSRSPGGLSSGMMSPSKKGGSVGVRGRSYSPEGGRDRDRDSNRGSGRKRDKSTSGSGSRRRHPVEAYVDEPLLCEYLWNREKEMDKKKEEQPTSITAQDLEKVTKDAKDTTTDIKNDIDDATPKPSTITEKTPPMELTTYESYRKQYCVDYIRSFFNAHLDDQWFKTRYSPHHRKKTTLNETQRAIKEAQTVKTSITSSTEAAQTFLFQSRLGIGTPKRRKRSRYDEPADEAAEDVTLPQSHMIAGHDDSVVRISSIPPYVTDAQLQNAIREHTNSPPVRIASTSAFLNVTTYCNSLVRSAYAVFENEGSKEEFLDNLTKANVEARRIPKRLLPQEDTSGREKYLELDIDCTDPYGRLEIDYDGRGGAPPTLQKDDEAGGKEAVKPTPKPGDPGAPSVGALVPKVPPRKVSVLFHTSPVHYKPNVATLSASLSTCDRLGRDKAAALMIARALDNQLGIPDGNTLDDLLLILFPNIHQDISDDDDDEDQDAIKDEDVLDVAIAYLRRVHLFSFYNGGKGGMEGDVLEGKSCPSGTIHLRLKDADNILREATGSVANTINKNTDESLQPPEEKETHLDEPIVSEDLLVRRLDESINRALEESTKAIKSNLPLVDKHTSESAKQIEIQEQAAKKHWLHNHALLDTDGRARCSFHFCRKLFKDKTFLHKHLLKKHQEFLHAEMAKCHDSFMMERWEVEENRPVPQILVDCGRKFGFIPITVTGKKPDVVDPEPELVQRRQEEEHLLLKEHEERKRRNEQLHFQRIQASRNRHAENQYSEQGNPNEGGNVNSSMEGGGHHRKSGFVDVDDMKDEKVELSFDNLDVAVVLPKKKKRKKKKLL